MRDFLLAICLIVSCLVCVPASAQCEGGACSFRGVRAVRPVVRQVVRRTGSCFVRVASVNWLTRSIGGS